uniref:Uncharacterized protein n=1 Tax=Anopheles coluzzii TaxID=1518534 RepID=A0A8W7PJE2_ANOCL
MNKVYELNVWDSSNRVPGGRTLSTHKVRIDDNAVQLFAPVVPEQLYFRPPVNRCPVQQVGHVRLVHAEDVIELTEIVRPDQPADMVGGEPVLGQHGQRPLFRPAAHVPLAQCRTVHVPVALEH